jgi:hypothetical protein
VEERQEGGIDAAAIQDSVRVRAHLSEREFPAKPVRDCEASVKANFVTAEPCSALDNRQRHAPVCPDERDIGIGRERPPPTGRWGEEGGMAEGVAHAPLVSDSDTDSGTDADTGGTERRPMRPREAEHLQ